MIDLVRHGRHVGAARRARAHHAGDLRDAERGQRRLVVEDAAEVLAVGEHLGVLRQVGAAGVDQIDARQPVLARDLLRAQVLLHRHREIGAALDGGVVAHDHALAPRDAADARDDAGAVDVLGVEAEGRQRRQLQERRARIDQPQHAIARQQLAARGVPLLAACPARPRRPPRASRARSATSARMAAALALNSSDEVEMDVLILGICCRSTVIPADPAREPGLQRRDRRALRRLRIPG